MDSGGPQEHVALGPKKRPSAAEGPAQCHGRITSPAELHNALGLPIPSFYGALDPIPVDATTFCSRLLPAFACGVVPYRVRVGAIRHHKRVAFLEVHVLRRGEKERSGAQLGGTSTLTQLVVDAQAVGDCFAQIPFLCLGDVLDIEARWILDPSRAHPLNLATSSFNVASRWDTEPLVALRKGGYHKVRAGAGTAVDNGSAVQHHVGAGRVRGVLNTRRIQEAGSESEGRACQSGSLHLAPSGNNAEAADAHGR